MSNEISLNVLICDDEEPAHIVLQEYCSALDWIGKVDHAYDGLEAYQMLQKDRYQILLLDIEMPKLKGLELAERLENPPTIILTTAYPEFALDGYRIEALDYLLKPIRASRFLDAMERARSRCLQKSDSVHKGKDKAVIWLRADKKDHRIILKEILWIEADGDYLKVYLEKETKPLLVYKRLTELSSELPASDFVQVHRSFTVNIRKIKALEGHQLIIGEKYIPISKANREQVRRLF